MAQLGPSVADQSRRVSSPERIEQLRFYRDNLRLGLRWPLIAAVIALISWTVIEVMLDRHKHEVLEAANRRAAAITANYAEQLSRVLDEVDRTTHLAQYLWSTSNGAVRLEDYPDKEIFPESLFYITISDPNGNPVTSTGIKPSSFNYFNADWFQAHKRDWYSRLIISPPEISKRTGRVIVRFSRRLSDENGAFTGVAWAAVEPSYLTCFVGNPELRKGEFVSLHLRNGTVLASKAEGSQNVDGLQLLHKKTPTFSFDDGVRTEPGTNFLDGASRIVAWKRLNKYPVIAVTKFREIDVLSDHDTTAKMVRNSAALVTALLLGLGLLGGMYAIGGAWRRQQAQDVKDTYQLAVDGAQEGFYMLRQIQDGTSAEPDFRIEDCNERAAVLMGTNREAALGKRFSQIVPSDYRRDLKQALHRVEQAGFHEDEVRVPTDMSRENVWLYRRFIRSRRGLALILRDISATKAHEQELAKQANTYPLTGLPNRHWLAPYLSDALGQAAGNNRMLAVLFIDLDNFKNINDTLGHDVGDKVLCATARALKRAVRADDHVIRLGGDEFMVALEKVDSSQDVAQVAKQLLDALSVPIELAEAAPQRVNASIGISLFPQDGCTEERLLKHADIAMYAAKASGKGNYQFYNSQLSESLVLRLNKELALQRAVERNEFEVYYQPRIEMHSGQITSLEALIRWMHPELGVVCPNEFIGVAEDSGLIVPIGEKVIGQVCTQIAQWKAAGVPLVPVSVNVAPLQLKKGGVSRYFKDCLLHHGLDAALLEVELTESAAVDRSLVVSQELQALRELGIKLLIDDFGTGYSSLAQLHRLDVDVLKVDKAFTDLLNESSDGSVLFHAIVSMADALDMCVIAEGVETMAQFDELKRLGCDEIQGYLISQALPGAAVTPMLRKQNLMPHTEQCLDVTNA